MHRWEFTPYNLEKWNSAKERILFVAPEPNGDNPNGENLDMGHWFRNAKQNNYYKNKQFYNRCEFILNGIITTPQHSENVFNNLRFMDLKATQGGGQANQNHVLEYVNNNLNETTKYFNSTDMAFGLSPHIIVLLGNKAQSIFVRCIRDQLINDKNLKWIGMPHPSHTVGYEGLKYACKDIRRHLKPINEQAEKWVYHKDDFNDWRKIV